MAKKGFKKNIHQERNDDNEQCNIYIGAELIPWLEMSSSNSSTMEE